MVYTERKDNEQWNVLNLNNSFKLKIEYLSIHIDIVENYANDNSKSINHIVYIQWKVNVLLQGSITRLFSRQG